MNNIFSNSPSFQFNLANKEVIKGPDFSENLATKHPLNNLEEVKMEIPYTDESFIEVGKNSSSHLRIKSPENIRLAHRKSRTNVDFINMKNSRKLILSDLVLPYSTNKIVSTTKITKKGRDFFQQMGVATKVKLAVKNFMSLAKGKTTEKLRKMHYEIINDKACLIHFLQDSIEVIYYLLKLIQTKKFH